MLSKEILTQVTQEMSPNGMTKKELASIFNQKDPKARKAYIGIVIDKCTANNKLRVSLGEIGNYFWKEGNLFFPYKNQEGPIYSFDEESARKRRDALKIESEERLEDFKSKYDWNYCNHFMPPKHKTLVIVGCSKEKNLDSGDLPVLERYLGDEIIRVKKLKEVLDFDLYILSAKYGLIPETSKVPYYDLSFNDLQTKEIRKLRNFLKIRETFEKIASYYDTIFLVMGKRYMYTLDFKEEINSDAFIVGFTTSEVDGAIRDFKVKNGLKINIKNSEWDRILKTHKGCNMLNARASILYDYFKDHSIEEFRNNPESLKESI
nr:MAG TPA: YaaA [Bacteriophage sp.]